MPTSPTVLAPWRMLLALALVFITGTLAHAQPTNEISPGIHRLDRLLGARPFDDLRPLDAIIGNASVVGLGESIHTSGGFQRIKLRLVQYLVEERGFRALGFETAWIPAESVVSYLQTCTGDARVAARGLYGVWEHETSVDLLRWMCRFNQQHPTDPVSFFGFDIQQSGDDARALRDFLAQLGIGVDDPRSRSLDRCYLLDGFPFVVPPPISAAENQACLEGLTVIDDLLTTERATIINLFGRRALDRARMHTIGLRGWQGQSFHFRSNARAATEARDVAMARVVDRQRAALPPGTKTLLWAHDAHVAQGAYSGPTRWMGSYLKATHGTRYASVAITAFEHYIDWPGAGCGLWSTARAPSVESTLAGLGEEHLLVDLDRVQAATNRLFDPAARTTVGHVFDMVPRANFDGIVYLRRSLAIRPRAWTACGAQVVGRGLDPVPGCPLNPGHGAFCDTCGPCLVGEGDCDTNRDCAPGLACAPGAGPTFGLAADVDVCVASGSGPPPPPPPGGCDEPLGGGRHCTACGPCAAGEGDCDRNSECQPGLTCVDNVGAQFGFAPGIDVCTATGDTPPPPPPGGCNEPVGAGRYCSTCGPCESGQGDCDNDAECQVGLTCVDNIGAQFGFAPGVDVCVAVDPPPNPCAEPLGSGRYCASCGPCTAGQGDCDSDAECQSGLSCLDNVGAQFGFAPGVDVCG